MNGAYYNIMVLEQMIAAFDKKPPSRGRETTAFIKRWKKKELDMPHRSAHHLTLAVSGINRAEIESIRKTKKFRDEPRRYGNQFARG